MCCERNTAIALLRNEREGFKLEVAAICERHHRAVLEDGAVSSEADRTIAKPVGGVRRLVLREVGSDSQAAWLENRLVRSCRTCEPR